MKDTEVGNILNKIEKYSFKAHKKESIRTKIYNTSLDRVREFELRPIFGVDTKLLHRRCKDLLRFSKVYNESMETLCIYSQTYGSCHMIKGRCRSVQLDDIGYRMVTNKEYAYDLILVHNHEENEIFSVPDFCMFYKYRQIKALVVITNNGRNQHIMLKTFLYCTQTYYDRLNSLIKEVLIDTYESYKAKWLKKHNKISEYGSTVIAYKMEKHMRTFLDKCGTCGMYYE